MEPTATNGFGECTIRVYKPRKHWLAKVAGYELLAQGATPEQAVARLARAIAIEPVFCAKHGIDRPFERLRKPARGKAQP